MSEIQQTQSNTTNTSTTDQPTVKPNGWVTAARAMQRTRAIITGLILAPLFTLGFIGLLSIKGQEWYVYPITFLLAAFFWYRLISAIKGK